MAAVSSCLCNDILTEILKRLPEESLLRFKCVEKSWYDLIKSRDFISIYSNHQNIKHGMATALAVYSATKKLEVFLNTDPYNMEVVLAQLSYNWLDYKRLQYELEDMQSFVKQVEEKFSHVPQVNITLSVIRRLALNVTKSLNSDFIKYMLRRRRRSVFERMLSGVCNRRETQIHSVFKGIKSLKSSLNFAKASFTGIHNLHTVLTPLGLIPLEL